MFDLIKKLVDFVLHIDAHLAEIIRDYGTWTYAVLFLIIFAETGLVVTPFLPGDSLLFAAGAFYAQLRRSLATSAARQQAKQSISMPLHRTLIRTGLRLSCACKIC